MIEVLQAAIEEDPELFVLVVMALVGLGALAVLVGYLSDRDR